MVADTKLTGLLLTGNHAGRPAANTVAGGTLYACSTHALIYQSDGSSWSTWASLGGTETLPVSIIDAKGDLIAGTAADTAARLAVGSNDQILMADSGQSSGLKWVSSQTPSTQAFSDSATEGTADTYARGDHKHGMPADPGGGGGGDPAIDCKGWVAPNYASTNAFTITIPAQASGTRILVAVGTRNNDVTSLSCTNVTWTEVKGWNSSTSTYLSIYVGVVSGGSSGTTITVNVGGTNYVFATAVFLGEALTPTTGADASFTGTASTNRRLPLTIATTPGDIVVMAYTTSDASSPISAMEMSSPFLIVPDQSLDALCGLHLLVGKAGADHVSGWYDGGNGSAIVVGMVAIS